MQIAAPNICFSTLLSTSPWGGEPSNFHGIPDNDLIGSILSSSQSIFSINPEIKVQHDFRKFLFSNQST